MTPLNSQPSKEDVLNAFSVEQDTGKETLQRYLRAYPAYAADLIDLSLDLNRLAEDDSYPLEPSELLMIDAAWERLANDGSPVDPLACLSTSELREVAKRLGVPRQVITAFREHRVMVSTIPVRFLERFAVAISTSADDLRHVLSMPISETSARSYKADSKDRSDHSVSFDQVLKEAGLNDQQRNQLTSDAD